MKCEKCSEEIRGKLPGWAFNLIFLGLAIMLILTMYFVYAQMAALPDDPCALCELTGRTCIEPYNNLLDSYL